MKTATLTILKRLLAMALGALGLGAFAALPASAQEIPAPDLFDGQVACSMNVPTPPMSLVGKDRDGMDIGITAKIESGMTINVGTSGDAAFGTPQGDDAGLADILYVIDPNLGNCGAGWVTNDAGEYLDAEGNVLSDQNDPSVRVAVAIAPGIAADVGEGYTETLTAFQAVVAADTDVEAKQGVLNELLEDEIDDDIQTAEIATARENLMKSQAAQTTAHNALYAATGPDRDGSIYRAGVAEWRAKGAVEAAITSWNEAVEALSTADTALTTSTDTFGDYVPLQNSTITDGQILSLIADPDDPDSDVNLANVRTYANAEGGNEATQAMDGMISGTSNFDAAGNLLIPLEDADSDDATPLTQVTSAQTYSVVDTQLTRVNNVVTALEKLQSENNNALLQGAIDEAVRRAKEEQKHYQAQFDKLVADNTDLDTGTDGIQSFKTMYDAVRAATTKRDNAGVALETAVQKREAATAAVRTAFTSPQSFYQQLVDRRQYVKDQADAEVTRLAGLEGDEAPTQKAIDDANKAASDAEKALTAANETLASFQDLIGEDSPVADLVLETLKPDSGMGAGDDGGVLVDTIGNAFTAAENAANAAANAETAATAAGNAVAGLTAMDDPETEEDETGAVTKNANDIANLQTDIEGLTGDSGQVSQNTSDIEGLDGRVAANEDGIAGLTAMDDPETEEDETGAVTANANDISDLGGRVTANEMEIGMDDDGMSRIDHNEARSMANATEIGMDEDGMSRIDHNEARSKQNATDIEGLDGRVTANESDIADNAGLIADNAGNISTNSTNISTNAGNILANTMEIGMDEDGMSRIDHNEAGVAANSMAIGVNAGNISTNAGNITENAGNIMANAGNIMTNAGNIAANEMAIGANASDIMTNAGNIAMNNTYIMENRTMIGANASAIGANTAAIAAANSRIDANAMAVRELREDMSGGIAAAMALAGMPEIGDRGVSIGAGSYDGESAVAVGVHFSGENSRFKAAITSGGGETGVSVGAGWSF